MTQVEDDLEGCAQLWIKRELVFFNVEIFKEYLYRSYVAQIVGWFHAWDRPVDS